MPGHVVTFAFVKDTKTYREHLHAPVLNREKKIISKKNQTLELIAENNSQCSADYTP